MARKDDFSGVTQHCIMCTKPIPETRRRDAVTCSQECSRDRANYIRSRQDNEECRYCFKPSTPEERERFKKWKKWEEKGLSDEQTSAALLRKVQSLERKLAELQEGKV